MTVQRSEVEGLEVFVGGASDAEAPAVVAAHPAEAFGAGTVELLAALAGARVLCINPRGLGGSSAAPRAYAMEAMVDDIEAVRRAHAFGPWMFWGMSGGGWLAQIYAQRHREALTGIVVESACACFRERLADAECVLSPFFPAWHAGLAAKGLLAAGSHASPSSGDETEWIDLVGFGHVWRRRNGPALLVSPAPVSVEMQRAMPMLWTFDARAWLPTITVPTLVIAGTADPVVPLAHGRAVHEAIAGSTFVAIDGGGHVPSAERRPEIADAIRRFIA